jgi:hypothetical protein
MLFAHFQSFLFSFVFQFGPTLAKEEDVFSTSQITIAEPPVCTVSASQSGQDDAPAILKAFRDCGHGGNIVLPDKLYHINSIMNTTGLKDVTVELRGRLEWGTNIQYWLNNSMPIGYQVLSRFADRVTLF